MKALELLRSQPLLSAVVVLLLVPMVLAAFVPVLAPIPRVNAGWTASPLPDRDESLGDFQHLLEPFPVLNRDLPDAESQRMVQLYDQTTYADVFQAEQLFDAAILAVPVPAELQSSWNSWLNTPEGGPVPVDVMESLVDDPLNGDRLSNLATAMFFYSIAKQPQAFEGAPYHAIKPTQLMRSAVEYFDSEDSRSASLNDFYFRFFTQPSGFLEGDLEQWISAHSGDVAILHLAVEKSISHPDLGVAFMREFLIEQASRLTESDDPALVAFGYAMLGDLHLGNLGLGDFMGNSRLENSPFEVNNAARLALGYYDQALQFSDDPSLYLARAFTLSILGEVDPAIETLERALELYPDLPVLYRELSDLFLVKRGSAAEIRLSMQAARDVKREALSLRQERPDARLGQTRIYNNFDANTVQVANQPLANSMWLGHGGGGGGYSVTLDDIPAFNSVPQDVLSLSAALGDTQGLLDDAERFGFDYPTYQVVVAQLVSDPDAASVEELQDSHSVATAADWLLFAGLPGQAQHLCETALEVVTNEWTAMTLNRCIAHSAYLLGDFETAEELYYSNDASDKAGFVAEMRGDTGAAQDYYSTAMDSRFYTRYMAMVRMAGVKLDAGDHADARQLYDEWLAWADAESCDTIKCISCVGDDCQETTHMIPFVLSNRGIGWLQMSADRNGSIDCRGEDREACITAMSDFDSALEYDAYNPLFLMNRAWVARLMGDHELSTELMSRALESDSTLYPVLTDMGVYAAEGGDSDSARGYFKDAVAANPDYDLGWWNLGVLEMRNGPRGIIRGQAYLARALVRNPSLVTSSLNFKTDESIYRVEIGGANDPGAGWAFGTASSLATTALGLLGAALIVFRASTHVLKDKVVEYLSSLLESVRPWWEKEVAPRLVILQSWKGIASALVVLTILVMVIAAIVPTWRGDPATAPASVTIALFALVLAVVTHESGHRLSAKLMGARIEPVQWAPGIGLSLFLLPFNLSSGPFPAQRVTSDDETNTLWVYLFGPLANLFAAIAVYMVYLNQPLPVLRVIAITQLAVMSYSLLPFDPLDGAALSRAQPKLVGTMASGAFLAGVLFSVGIL